jgi:hypothetical protein
MRKKKFISSVNWQQLLKAKWHKTMASRNSQSNNTCEQYVKDEFTVETQD